MRALASDAAHLILDVVRYLGAWMSFNAFLATVPAVLAVVLFHRPRARTVTWWVGVVAFGLFLPNAPYVVTDLIHAGALVDRFTGSSRLSSLVPLAAIGTLVVYGLGRLRGLPGRGRPRAGPGRPGGVAGAGADRDPPPLCLRRRARAACPASTPGTW